MTDVCVVHLVWAPLGPEPVRRFAEAYRCHPAGHEHQLLVVLNGFADGVAQVPVSDLFDGIPHGTLTIPDPIQDIPAYFAAARAATAEYLCFLNSHSAPLADGWLAKLAAHAKRPEVGIVGATGSWESFYNGLVGPAFPLPRTLHPTAWAQWLWRSARRARRAVEAYPQFAPFPNAHLRSNAFMLRRSLFLDLETGPLVTKEQAHKFESGRSGMTRQILARGLQALVVGRDGADYPPDRWPLSGTYRTGEQENLLVADNRTRDYAAGDAATRCWLARLAWGSV